jgi:NAD(P)-dependent dehydrogenase (short-subunit alcohol dehydrogenase family)
MQACAHWSLFCTGLEKWASVSPPGRRRPTGQCFERRREKVPTRHTGKLSDMANAAVLLASGEASFITGDMLFVDGGIAYASS